ncbi:PREDICTED: uncharacterized protein LOC18614229 isoform X1 [Theobroma cacao]|uniref:Uncharacterized protein LOC18614229 isoform X1 n=1 Tax=Theobroma cacao TaxID=3641 RepID=A0AB32VTY7_THECC|nr:PREDICTED: uncharacterized protein LOC18614229 isoform X1 [Theobroma cacao]
MASSTISRQRKHFPLERRPRMLKDFLLDDSNSCSSNGFKSFPRKTCQSIRNLIETDLNSSHAKPSYAQQLQRSRSKAASTTISTFQAMIKAVRNIHFTSVKSPSILPRSLSRKLSKKNSQKETETRTTVRVKDIIRWKSSRDLVEEKFPPADFASSPHHCTTRSTTTTTTTGSKSTPCSSNSSSWCDSDFTSEYLPSEEYHESEVDVGKKFLPCVGKDPMETTTGLAANTAVGPKQGRKHASGEKEQHSPLSVLDFEYEEDDEESLSSFNRSLATMERKRQKLMQNIQRFESLAKLEPVNLEKWMSLEETEEDGEDDDVEEEKTNEVEEKAWQLLNHVKETSLLKSYRYISIDKLLLDLFREELATKWNETRKEEVEHDMIRQAEAWINGEQNETAKWRVWEKREAYVRDMDREGKWRKFEEEQEELALEVESRVMNILVDELLFDLL